MIFVNKEDIKFKVQTINETIVGIQVKVINNETLSMWLVVVKEPLQVKFKNPNMEWNQSSLSLKQGDDTGLYYGGGCEVGRMNVVRVLLVVGYSVVYSVKVFIIIWMLVIKRLLEITTRYNKMETDSMFPIITNRDILHQRKFVGELERWMKDVYNDFEDLFALLIRCEEILGW